jgi:hypothetical protein
MPDMVRSAPPPGLFDAHSRRHYEGYDHTVSKGSWRDLAVELADDGAWIRRMTIEISDRIHREIPELGHDCELSEATRQSVADNIRLFISMVVAGVPPDRARPGIMAEEYVRLLAQRGVGADVVTATYRIAPMAFWQA